MIQAEHVTKIFRSASQPKPHIAVSDLSCTIPGGCIYGLVGSNGAGKSTLRSTASPSGRTPRPRTRSSTSPTISTSSPRPI